MHIPFLFSTFKSASSTGTGPANKFVTNQSEFDALVINAGDTIDGSGGTYRGSKIIDRANVTVRNMTVNGSLDASALPWTDQGDGTWTTPMVTDPKWVYIGGAEAKMAETPGFLDVGSAPATTQISVATADLSGFTDIVGSYLVFKSRPFSYSERYTVIAYNGAGLITVDRDLHSSITGNSEYKLLNDPEYLAGNNEWCWRDGLLRIQSTVDPSTLNVTYSVEDYAFDIQAAGCTIDNVQIKEQYLYGIQSEFNNTTVNNCTITNIRGQGIKSATQFTGLTITNCTMHDIGHNAIWFGPQTNITITGNNINNIGMAGNIGWNNSSFGVASQTDGCAMKCNLDLNNLTHDANNITIEYNTIDNCAYNGISFHIGQNGLIRRNVVSNTNQRLADGGCIHNFHYRDTNVPFSGFTIEENFVTVNSTNEKTRGIYMDNRCIDNIIRNNCVITIAGEGGIHINADTENHTIDNNLVYSNAEACLRFRDWAAPDKIYLNDKNTITNNVFIAKNALVDLLWFDDSVNPYPNGGSGDNNYYFNPYGTTILDDGVNKTLAQLRSDYSVDASSIEQVNYIATTPDPDNEILIIQNPADTTLVGSAPAGNWYNKDAVLVTNYTVNPWDKLELFKDLI